ncbi:hypothetical protein NL676_035510 [Syzygium grande]|nr:hypothetical protein NL676_035510 [Syzygium grande]
MLASPPESPDPPSSSLGSPCSVRHPPRLFLCLHQLQSGSSAAEVGFASRLQAISFVFVFIRAHALPHAHPLESSRLFTRSMSLLAGRGSSHNKVRVSLRV